MISCYTITNSKFKIINDEYGHDKGDLVLIEVSKYLKSLKTPHNFIGRWGGEEFILITDNIYSENVHQFANKILSGISQIPLGDNQQELNITASIGIADVGVNSKTAWQSSLNKADNALYQAKDNGRNCYVIYAQ